MELLNHKVFGNGRPLIVLHGFLGSLDNWLTLGKKFAEEYQVILVDQRNHGKSFHSAQWGYDEMVDDLNTLIEHYNFENPILLGHSMGGKTVMQYGAYHDEKVSKIIVADIAPKFYPIHHQQILAGLNAIPIDEIKSREDADQILKQYILEDGVRTFLLKNLSRSSEGFSWKMNLSVLSNQISEIGKELNYRLPIETETLFIRGGASNYILDDDWNEIEEVFPNSKLDTINGVGHWLHAEKPSEFYNKVMTFINE
ncbi:alpha/beta fold hydrolase [Reichenbachiella versicolor]|uniref:alpha/beta fold hydrolase n=1 Tax=Reichenbachiella versicolor TaxID=1821036 RepID=UPI000D6E0371|nr:alpha/beta fold hydrolase [Reichenbachiella versicolor]